MRRRDSSIRAIVNGTTIPKGGVDSSHKQFAPRLGVAWDVKGDGKTSVRAGYGIYYDTPMLYMLNNMNLQSPFSFSVAFNDGSFDHPYAGRTNLNVFPFSGDFNTNSLGSTLFAAVVYEPKWQQPYTQNWNVTFRRILGQWLVQAGYVGTIVLPICWATPN